MTQIRSREMAVTGMLAATLSLMGSAAAAATVGEAAPTPAVVHVHVVAYGTPWPDNTVWERPAFSARSSLS